MSDLYGIYLHIPYCRAKCRYCDFYSAPGARGVPQAYVSALLRELAKNDRRPAVEPWRSAGFPVIRDLRY